MSEAMSKDPDWIAPVKRQVRHWIAQAGPENPAALRWVVAVSGGSDSVGLLLVLRKAMYNMGLQLSVAHLDHGARGEESRADAAFVVQLAEQLGLPVDLGSRRPTRAAHFETDARDDRLAWLTKVARSRGARFVAFGHTLDDQAETLLHRIVRGTGPRGLAGIPAQRFLDRAAGVVAARPLLRTRRQEIRDWLCETGHIYRDDATNCDITRTRARIRHDLLPKLAADYNPRILDALANLARLSHAATTASDRRVGSLSALVVRAVERDPILGTSRIILSWSDLQPMDNFERAEVLRHVWREASWPERGMTAQSWRRLALIAQLGRGGTKRDVGAGVTVEVHEGSVMLSRAARKRPDAVAMPVLLPIPGRVMWMGIEITAGLDAETPFQEAVDLDQVLRGLGTGTLWVRSALGSDRFAPLGMEGHGKRLVDFLRERGVPREDRGRVPIVVAADEVIWVAGHRIADRVKLTDDTKRVLYLRWASPADSAAP